MFYFSSIEFNLIYFHMIHSIQKKLEYIKLLQMVECDEK